VSQIPPSSIASLKHPKNPIFSYITSLPDWIRIATEIELNYSFDAFVILHGTDTMCYTSSALSFLLEDLGKTVVCFLLVTRSLNLDYYGRNADLDRRTNTLVSIT
jgi:hypothetical protein